MVPQPGRRSRSRFPGLFRWPPGAGGQPPRTEEIAIATFGKDQTRVNNRIRVPQVRLIGDDGQQIGVIATSEALNMAQEKGLDLVEVQATARPPVCRIMDYGKYKYEQSKKDRSARKRQHVMHLKEVKLRPKIEAHDYETKLGRAREFLEARDKVKFTLQFRGREIAYPERGRAILEKVVADLADVGAPEGFPRSEGRTMTMTMLPKLTKQPVKKPAAKPRPGPSAAPQRAKEPSAG